MSGKNKFLSLVVCFALVISAALVIAPMSISSPSQEPLDVSGSVNGTWTKSHGPYYIEDNVTIPFGSTLNIEPGVEVYFNGSYYIYIEGILYANGTDSDRIFFTSNYTIPGSGDWAGIQFNSTGKGNLDWCNLSYGNNLLYLSNASGIIISNCTLNMSLYGIILYSTSHNNLIYNCSIFYTYIGINVYLYSYNNTIQDCLLFLNSYGIQFSNAGENNTVINCEILNNYINGIVITYTDHLDIIDCEIGYNGDTTYDGVYILDSTYINISGGSVYNSGNDGIFLIQSSNCIVVDCQIYNNYYAGIIFNGNCNGNTVDNCSLYNNYDGIEIVFSINNTISNCTFTNNTQGIDANSVQSSINKTNIDNCDFINNTSKGINIYSSRNINITACNFFYNDVTFGDAIGVEFSSFINITGSIIGYSGDNGIYFIQSSDCYITDCEIFNNNIGIFVYDSIECYVINCEIYNNGDGVLFSSGGDHHLERCNVFNNFDDGVEIENSANCEVKDSDIFYNYCYGLNIAFTSDATVTDSNISNNYIGIWIYESAFTTITNCNLSANNYSAINLDSTTSSTNITNCNIFNTQYSATVGFGVQIAGSSFENLIEDCNIYNNVFGIDIKSSNSNIIKNTKFFHNDFGIELRSGSSFNTFDGVEVNNNYNYGISLIDSNINYIKNSDILVNNGGVYVEYSEYNQFTNLNVINNMNWGFRFAWSQYNTVSGCKIQDHLGEGLGFYASDSNNILNSNISNNNDYGVYIESAHYNYILDSAIYNNYGGIYSREDTSLSIFNSKITTFPGLDNDFYFVEDVSGNDAGGEITALNTTFNTNKVEFAMAYESQLEVLWYLHIQVVDQYMNPIPNTGIYIWNDLDGIESQVYYISDNNGWIRNIICTDYIQYSSYEINYNPYTISSNIPGYGTYNKQVTMDHTQTIYFILSPVDLVAQKLTYSTTMPVDDEDLYINTTVYNNNPDIVYDVDVKYSITRGFDDIYSSVLKVTEIPAYGTGTASLFINFSQPEDYTIEVEVDVYNLIDEHNEGNNTIIDTFTIYQKPEAVLEVSSTSVNVDDLVSFYGNNSQSYTGTIIRYIFDFGDGSPITKTPLFMTDHTYSQEGYYYTSLRIEDENGKFSDKTFIWIEVKKPTVPNQKPVANFTIEPDSGTVRTSFKFVSTSFCPDEGGRIVSRIWDFGDGNTSNWLSPFHNYAQDGIYTISLVVWDDDQDKSDYFNKTLTVNNLPPEPELIASKTVVDVKDAIEFDASSTIDPDDTLYEISTVFLWDFGDGDTYSESPINYLDGAYDKKTLHSYSKSGLFNVTLTVFDDDGAMNQTVIQISVNSTGEPDPDSGDDGVDSWFKSNAQWAIVIISFIVAIVLAVLMLLVYRKKGKKTEDEDSEESEEDKPEPAPSYQTAPKYDAVAATQTGPEQDQDFKPQEFEVGADDGISPTDITPVSKLHKRKKKKKKAKPKKAKKEPEEPVKIKEVVRPEEEEDWDFEEAEIEEIEAKSAATMAEYPELGEEDEITVDDEDEVEAGVTDIGVEIEPELEHEPEPEPTPDIDLEPEMEPEPELEIEEPIEIEPVEQPVEVDEIEADTVEPAWTAPMPGVAKPSKPRCRWCEREIEGKYIKGRRKRDPKTGDEYFVEGPFCTMKCANEYFK